MKILLLQVLYLLFFVSCSLEDTSVIFDGNLNVPQENTEQNDDSEEETIEDEITENDTTEEEIVVEEVDPVYVDLSGNGDYSTLNDAIVAGEKKIIMNSGAYEVDSALTIEQDGVIIEGLDKNNTSIIQLDSGKDLFIIKSNNVIIRNLTLDAVTHDAQAVIVEAGASNLLVENNNIYGGSNIIPIFFAGPPVAPGETNSVVKDETIDVFLGNGESQYDFSKNNKIKNNYVSTYYNGSALAFSLQQNGEISGNTIIGGTLNLSLNKDITVTNNTIGYSTQSAVSINLPSANVTVSQNTILSPGLHGIMMLPHYEEHGHQDENIVSNTIEISNNTITASVYGIALQGYNDSHETWGSLSGVTVNNNTINQKDFSGMWFYDLSNVEVDSNTINFQDCSISSRGTGDIPSIASRDSAGIHLYDGLSNFVVSNNTITKKPHVEVNRSLRMQLRSATQS